MKDYLLKDGKRYIKAIVDGLKLTYTFSDDPKTHYVTTLKDKKCYDELKKEINDAYNSSIDKEEGYWLICEEMQCVDFHDKYFIDGEHYMYQDIRDREEINEYLDEAFDKVWLMRSHPCEIPSIEARRLATVERILETYDDVPEEGYTDWDCGYWNGIMGALRWVLGDEKNFLDT